MLYYELIAFKKFLGNSYSNTFTTRIKNIYTIISYIFLFDIIILRHAEAEQRKVAYILQFGNSAYYTWSYKYHLKSLVNHSVYDKKGEQSSKAKVAAAKQMV